ncbi:hypothetical protein BDV09DRAFT_190736 [Aspergillus tetrazonus]
MIPPMGSITLSRRACKLLAGCLTILLLLSVSFIDNINRPDSGLTGQCREGSSRQYTVFLRKIWQIWKTDPPLFEERELIVARSWTSKSLGYHYKADWLCYLVMYVDGGVYMDINVNDLKPINQFIPDQYNKHDVDMVIGVEINEPDFRDHLISGRNPAGMDFDDVITSTGPSAFTNSMLAEISLAVGYDVTWNTFHDMVKSKLVGSFLVLTVKAFAAGQGHSDSGNHGARTALVKHHYHASGWPNKHPRYKRPIYGEVEKCNWNKQCVRQWDENMASFAALSAEEQEIQIAEKKAANEEEERLRAAEEAKARENEVAAAEVDVKVDSNEMFQP